MFRRPLARSSGQVVRRVLVSNSCEGVGVALLAMWRAMQSLLGIALELEHYMSGLDLNLINYHTSIHTFIGRHQLAILF